MFKQIAPLLATCTSLTIILATNKDGSISATVLPKSKQVGDDVIALNTPLSVTATAEELDENFAKVLTDYVSSHQSLAQQLENTTTILEAAKAESQKKAATTISKASTKSDTPKVTKAAISDDSGDDNDENGDADNESGEVDSESLTTAASTPLTAESATAADLWG